LILDEPTSGLDPNQLVEIRSLIQQLGKEKTVIFSTHIMQEVQAICDRVLIINKGKLVANDPIQNLQSRVKGSTLVSIEFKEEVKAPQLQAIEGVQEVKNVGKRKWQLISGVERDIRADVFKFAVANQLTLLELRQEVFSVEDIFQKLTADS